MNAITAANDDEPKAMKLANLLETVFKASSRAHEAAWELRRQHAEIERLRAENDRLKQQLSAAKSVPMKYKRMAFNAELQKENEELKQQLGQRMPDGWKLVPVEPTDAMVQAAHHLDLSYMPGQEGADRAAIYHAMLSAAPAQPEQQKRWALCTETDTPCSTGPTLGITCEAAAQPAPWPLETDKPVAQDEPAAWVKSLDEPQPHCVTSLRYCSAEAVMRGEERKYIPLYTRPQPAQRVPEVGSAINLVVDLAHRKGELWERCQGKCWPEAESDEFAKLRDDKLPAAIAQLQRALTSTPPSPQSWPLPGWEVQQANGYGQKLMPQVSGFDQQAAVVQQEPVLVVDAEELRRLLKRPEGDKHIKAWPGRPISSNEVALYTHPAQQAKPQPLSDEQDRALCEAYCNTASDEYFNARPQLDSAENRRIFYAGHRKAWINWRAAHGIKE